MMSSILLVVTAPCLMVTKQLSGSFINGMLITNRSVCLEFGANQLWIDHVDGFSQAEIWLELAAVQFSSNQHWTLFEWS